MFAFAVVGRLLNGFGISRRQVRHIAEDRSGVPGCSTPRVRLIKFLRNNRRCFALLSMTVQGEVKRSTQDRLLGAGCSTLLVRLNEVLEQPRMLRFTQHDSAGR